MCAVDFDDAEAGQDRTASGRSKGFDDFSDTGFIQRNRRPVTIDERNRARRDHRPPALRWIDDSRAAFEGGQAARFAARVRELDGRNSSHPFEEIRDTRERRDVAIVPYAVIDRRDTALCRHRARFDEDQRGSPDGAAAQMNQVPVIGESIRR